MFDEVNYFSSLLLVVLKALTEEKHSFQREVAEHGVFERVDASLDLALELLAVASVEWGESVEELKKDDADGPDIRLVVVLVLLDYLGRHVKWGTADGLVQLVLGLELLREAEVSNFDLEVDFEEVDRL